MARMRDSGRIDPVKVKDNLLDMLATGRYDRVLLVLEKYSSSGLVLELTPPIEKALDHLREVLMRCVADETFPTVELTIASSPVEAARFCRNFGDAVASEALASSPAVDVRGKVRRADLWQRERSWLTEIQDKVSLWERALTVT